MHLRTIICGFLVAWTSAANAGTINCVRTGCPGKANQRWHVGPPSAKCGELVEDGSICGKRRSKIYYVCSTCRYTIVSNKQMLLDSQEGCTHENRYLLAPGQTPPNDSGSDGPSAAASGAQPTPSTSPSGLPFYNLGQQPTNPSGLPFYDFFQKE
ncbi:hypothetical protein PGT21_015101 [Puccinia graminis f. sp. tritici]|uniref:Secreted protein n=2 Tax=Puccinia graminis f. sp. tritici TaxID=56615 RepID=E3JYA7_PUCGT|nr:uncharacterized protein PGTG_02988 [Puccinia graminis f. sp. tritici CRL 75-36-700-3]EFP77032.1 hypothetical protein PGTG_02988 [Puccinia graminis f. sp. tritici CRL 75-36-700-3]KAA1102424.1 hypothetical protein PGTUg99_034310 [Puccinia graminis f. sp. tritici]KAA1114608.1 hypothetical protein PGT21_015101 [Puccinia graminis f. sp. tritici]